MPTSVEPRHAHPPLPGGSPAATVSVEPLLCGETPSPPDLFDRHRGRVPLLHALLTPRSRWVSIPIPAFLVRHPTAGPMLVDTGFHQSVASDPKQNLGPVTGRLFAPRMRADQALPAQLEARGVAASDVRCVILTHLHYDHASGIVHFPDATFVVDRVEWDAASAGGPRDGYHPPHFDHAFDWRTIDFASREADSFATFGRSADLFGDGSVRLLSTPGHSAGHMSVLLRLRERELLLCGDAIYTLESLKADLEPLFCADRHRYERSRAEIRLFAEQTPSATVIPGHDPHAWAALAERYE